MPLKQARKEAIFQAGELLDGTVDVYRIGKRKFAVCITPPENGKLVFVAHAELAKSGWYKKYHPEWLST